MYSSQLQLKFSNVSEAKIAAQSLCELLKSRISVFDFHGLQVTVGKDGDLSISVRFQDVKAMNDFEKDIPWELLFNEISLNNRDELFEKVGLGYIYAEAIAQRILIILKN